MAVEKYIIQFRILDEIRLQEEPVRHSNEIIKQILDYTQVNNVIPDSYEPYTGQELVKRLDQAIEKTETIVSIIFNLDELDVDFHGSDPAGEVYAQALKSLKDASNVSIVDYGYREENAHSQTLIELMS